jgi:thiol-disulfide isomerase/thioredoxin
MLKSIIINFILVILLTIGIIVFGFLRTPQLTIKDYGNVNKFNLPIYHETLEFQELSSLSSDFFNRDEPTLIMFFASWCKQCITKLPKLAELKKLENIKIIGIATGDSKQDLSRMFSKIENPFDIIAFDETGLTGRDFNIRFIPQFMVTKKGHIFIKSKTMPGKKDIENLK